MWNLRIGDIVAGVEKMCPNCRFFYMTGKTEWEDHPKCVDCVKRGGFENNWMQKVE